MRVEVLDHGYVELVESWGSDERIIEAARMSTAKGFQSWGPHRPTCAKQATDGVLDCDCPQDHAGDEKLLRFLYTNAHHTPFEMAGAVFEIQAPIFVFREWHRHRTQSYNELSARYTPLPDVNYVPTAERMLLNAGANKQAQSTGRQLSAEDAEEFRQTLHAIYSDTEHAYQMALQAGVPKELARLVIPVGRYSRMRASANLRNWLGFLTLRQAHNAQWEIRQFANVVAELIATSFPRTAALYQERKSA